MVRSLKVLILCLPLIISLSLVSPISMAEASFLYPGDILVDDFEYEGYISYSHGWTGPDPPTYGYGGYSSAFHTALDLQQGSRVLDVYRPSSIFLIGTPYAHQKIAREIGADARTHGVISFDFRAPPHNEARQSFQMDIFCSNADGDEISICLVPTDIQTDGNGNEGMDGTVIIEDEAHSVTVGLGPSLLDGSWHTVWIDLVDMVQKANDMSVPVYPNDYLIRRVDSIQITSGIFRLENIIMRANQTHRLFKDPYLFKIDAVYPRIFDSWRYLFVADYQMDEEGIKVSDLMFNSNNFLLVQDPNDPNDPVVRYWMDLGADPNLFGENDPNIARNVFDRESFVVDLSLPIFANSDLRVGGPMAEEIINSRALDWNSYIHGFTPQGYSKVFVLQALEVNPSDGMPTYLPSYYDASDAIASFGRPYFPPQSIHMLEGALWNVGVSGYGRILRPLNMPSSTLKI